MLARVGPFLSVAALGFLASGCASDRPSVPNSVRTGARLLDAGGAGGELTRVFETTGSEVRVDYRLARPPQTPQVVFVAERDAGNGNFQTASTLSQTAPSGLAGTATLSLIPGRYRLRIDTDAPWTATISQPKP